MQHEQIVEEAGKKIRGQLETAQPESDQEDLVMELVESLRRGRSPNQWSGSSMD